MPTAVRWSDASTLEVDGIRRSAFYFRSSGVDVYASLHAAVAPSRGMGVVVAPSWGQEAGDGLALCHGLARGVAELGGAGLVLHWPGLLDSEGDVDDVTVPQLVQACVDAAGAADDRVPGMRWSIAGMQFGAAVAALAAPVLDAPHLVLVQPALDPKAALDRMERQGRRMGLGAKPPPGWAFGHPLPAGLRDAGAADDVKAAIDAFRGTGVVVRYAKPEPGADEATGRLPTVTVAGDWRRRRYRDHRPLTCTALQCLKRAERNAR